MCQWLKTIGKFYKVWSGIANGWFILDSYNVHNKNPYDESYMTVEDVPLYYLRTYIYE